MVPSLTIWVSKLNSLVTRAYEHLQTNFHSFPLASLPMATWKWQCSDDRPCVKEFLKKSRLRTFRRQGATLLVGEGVIGGNYAFFAATTLSLSLWSLRTPYKKKMRTRQGRRSSFIFSYFTQFSLFFFPFASFLNVPPPPPTHSYVLRFSDVPPLVLFFSNFLSFSAAPQLNLKPIIFWWRLLVFCFASTLWRCRVISTTYRRLRATPVSKSREDKGKIKLELKKERTKKRSAKIGTEKKISWLRRRRWGKMTEPMNKWKGN